MGDGATFAIRREELSRRVEALPTELKDWKDRTEKGLDLQVHSSQIRAIEVLIGAYVKELKQLLGSLDPTQNVVDFSTRGFALIQAIIKAQKIWDFFRSKLELRFSPKYKGPLWVADTVAWNCHRPVLDAAAGHGILDPSQLREPPLTYLTAEFSPATWVRGSRPNDGRNYVLGASNLPIPVLELPWDHLENYWEFCSLHHEVGHDLEADLRLKKPLAASLQEALLKAKVPQQRLLVWLAWQGELFADLVGLQLAGPAFAESMVNLLLLPPAQVTQYSGADPHPTHYVRVLINTAYMKTMAEAIKGDDATLKAVRDRITSRADAIAARWVGFYGDQPFFRPFLDDAPTAFAAMMDTPVAVLKGKTVRDLMPYSAVHDEQIEDGAKFLATGQNMPNKIEPRHCVAAARLAVSMVAGDADLKRRLTEVQARTETLIRANTPDEVRGGTFDPTAHQRFIEEYATFDPF